MTTYDEYCEAGNPPQKCPRCEVLHEEHDFGGLCEPCHAQLIEDGEIEVQPEDVAGPNGCTCGFNGDCNCPFGHRTGASA